MITEDDVRRIIREELRVFLASIQRTDVRATVELPVIPPLVNDFQRAKRAALEAREKSQQRRKAREAHNANQANRQKDQAGCRTT